MLQSHRLAATILAGTVLVAIVGCGGGLAPVRGKVTLPDGKPAAGSQVVFESQQDGKHISARGDVHEDGSYELSTFKPGDGVPPGKYRAQVNSPPMLNAEAAQRAPFNAKFTDFSTSGLEFEVKSGTNDFAIPLTK